MADNNRPTLVQPENLAHALRRCIEELLNDRKGLHWDDLDDDALRELRKDTVVAFVEVIQKHANEEGADQDCG